MTEHLRVCVCVCVRVTLHAFIVKAAGLSSCVCCLRVKQLETVIRFVWLLMSSGFIQTYINMQTEDSLMLFLKNVKVNV